MTSRCPLRHGLGDLLCLPVTGAYTYSMSSNYNGLCRPAVVMVGQGRSRVIVRRESIDDLLRSDVLEVESHPGRHVRRLLNRGHRRAHSDLL